MKVQKTQQRQRTSVAAAALSIDGTLLDLADSIFKGSKNMASANHRGTWEN